MKHTRLSEQKWFNGAVVVCIGVVLFVLLTNFKPVLSAVGGFLGHFKSIFLGFVFAYVLNPLAKFFYEKVFRKMKAGNLRWYLAVGAAIVLALLILILLIGTLIPQLIQSVATFNENIDSYAASMIKMIEGSGLEK